MANEIQTFNHVARIKFTSAMETSATLMQRGEEVKKELRLVLVRAGIREAEHADFRVCGGHYGFSYYGGGDSRRFHDELDKDENSIFFDWDQPVQVGGNCKVVESAHVRHWEPSLSCGDESKWHKCKVSN